MNPKAIANPEKRAPLTLFRALTVADVHGRRAKVPYR
jgi:hypothetical protein